MEERVIDLSEEPADMSVRHRQLVIRQANREVTTPLEELAVLVVSHPAVRFTHAVLSGLCANGGTFVLCDEKRMPVGMLLPLEGHFVQTERFAAQAQASAPTKKQVWKQVVRAKILAQGHLLQILRGHDFGLSALAKKVRSGDPVNLEAQASRRYWPALFGAEFRRHPRIPDQNRLLNYGYAVLRAIVARAVCAAGLHPSLGVHHHNRYDAFCLADDLMEPFRPLIDCVVAKLVEERGIDVPVDKETKAALIGALIDHRHMVDGEQRTLFDLLARTANSLAMIFLGKRKKLFLPVL